MKKISLCGLLCAGVMLLTIWAQAQAHAPLTPPLWEFTTQNNAITITKYIGTGSTVNIHGTINGLPVVSIGEKAFFQCTNVTSVTLPASIKNVGDYAFGMCSKLKGVYFMGSAPDFGSAVFYMDEALTVYYLRESAGWTRTCGDRPTAQWDLADQSDAAGSKPLN